MSIESQQFSVYGLVFSTNRIFAGYLAAPKGDTPDITLHIGDGTPSFATFCHVFELNYHTAITPEKTPLPPDIDDPKLGNFCYRIRYWNGIEFVINANGTEIWAQWPDDICFDLVAAYFSGPIMGFILKIHGFLCLHASVVEIDSHAVALMAPSGCGKSTTAAALAKKGYPILSDDILVINPFSDVYHAQPGYPGVRLCPDSASMLFNKKSNSLHVTPDGDKRYLELPQAGCRFCDKPRPLAAIYTGGPDKTVSWPEFKTAPHASALKTLLCNTYPGNYYKLPGSLRAAELNHLAQLTRKIPLREITYQRDLDHLSGFCDALVADARMVIHYPNNLVQGQMSG